MQSSTHTSLELLNDSTQRDTDWWDWSLWIEGSAADLDAISAVTYKLHPSFPSPVQTVRDRATKFRLGGAGWGEFMVDAEAHLNDGTTVSLQRWLELDADADSPAPAKSPAPAPSKSRAPSVRPGRRPTLFISASAMDRDFVEGLSEALGTHGIDAKCAQDVAVDGVDIAAAIDAAMQASDGIIAIFSRGKSAWVESELACGIALGKPAFPVMLGNTEAPTMLKDMVHFDLEDSKEVAELADTIATRLKTGL
jgi:hypothetical protein